MFLNLFFPPVKYGGTADVGCLETIKIPGSYLWLWFFVMNMHDYANYLPTGHVFHSEYEGTVDV